MHTMQLDTQELVVVPSFLSGEWWTPSGEAARAGQVVRDASTGEPIAQVSAEGADIAGAIDFARSTGQQALGKLTIHERALKLKELAAGQQVLCVTHQAQVASKADEHFVVEKTMTKNRTSIAVRHLDQAERVEEIARMLAGEKITDAARENAREMIAAAG